MLLKFLLVDQWLQKTFVALPLSWHWPFPILVSGGYNFFLWYWSVYFLTEKTKWDVTRFADRVKNVHPRADGDNSTEDTRLAKFFTNPHFGDVDEPSTILDWHGRIMVWYLPGIFSPHRVVCIWFGLNIWFLNYWADRFNRRYQNSQTTVGHFYAIMYDGRRCLAQQWFLTATWRWWIWCWGVEHVSWMVSASSWSESFLSPIF